MLALLQSTVDEASADKRARISAVFLATVPARDGIDAGHLAAITDVVRKPTDQRAAG